MSNTSPVDGFKSLSRFEQGVLVTGVLAFIFSFFPWYGFSIHGFGSTSISAWHSYSTLALLLVLAATIFAAVSIFARSSLPDLPVGAWWIVAGLSVLGAFLEVLRLLTLHHGDGFSIRWGGYLLAIAMIANAVFSVMAAMASGQAAPWAGGTTGGTGGTTPPAAPPPSNPPTA
jgi:hypothetical protein